MCNTSNALYALVLSK